MNVMFGVNMRNPANEGRPTITGYVVEEGQPDRKLLELLTRVKEGPLITLYGPDGERIDVGDIGEVEHDSEVDNPMNLAWTGDENSGFMDKVKLPLFELGLRVVAADTAAKMMPGLNAQEVFHDMSRDIEGAVVGYDKDAVKEEAKAKIEELAKSAN